MSALFTLVGLGFVAVALFAVVAAVLGALFAIVSAIASLAVTVAPFVLVAWLLVKLLKSAEPGPRRLPPAQGEVHLTRADREWLDS